MPSHSLHRWRTERRAALDEIASAHQSVGGTGPGRRYATQQINYAYAALLSSHFQGFCRDLHSECIDHIVAVVPSTLQPLLRIEMLWNRTLDRGNPHPGAIGSDFNRLGVQLWMRVNAADARNVRRNHVLQDLVNWRNAIAHQDFLQVGGDPTLHLSRVRGWRRTVGALSEAFDVAMRDYLTVLLGRVPW
jgi:hypothetical protein